MNSKVIIEIRLSGKVLARVGLTPLEYEAIRLSPPEEAISRLMRKDEHLRANPALILQVLQLVASGRFQVAEVKDELAKNQLDR